MRLRLKSDTNIFISYAREDFDIAHKLYKDLKDNGLSPWIDEEDLLPGQNWKLMIDNAIRNSRYFIALLSKNSISKRGYVQKELKIAIDILDEFPSSEIFFIPIRLDPSVQNIDLIKNIHWLDLFLSYEDGLKKIFKIIETNQRYSLRSDPIKLHENEFFNNHSLDDDGIPVEYICNNFEDKQNGTVFDHATGLIWQKSCSEVLSNYIIELDKPPRSAIDETVKLNLKKFAGYNRWRLPTIEELISLLQADSNYYGHFIDPIFEKSKCNLISSDVFIYEHQKKSLRQRKSVNRTSNVDDMFSFNDEDIPEIIDIEYPSLSPRSGKVQKNHSIAAFCVRAVCSQDNTTLSLLETVSNLIDSLSSDNYDIRHIAQDELLKLNCPSIVPILKKAYKSVNGHGRTFVSIALENLRTDESLNSSKEVE